MAHYSSVPDQMLRLIPRQQFLRIVQAHQGDKKVRRLTCWRQFVCLFYAQLTGQHTLRDLVTALNANLHKLRHAGVQYVGRSTLADANSRRPHQIYRDLFELLYRRCRRLAPRHGFAFAHKVYALDASLITLSLKVFDWARFRAAKGAVKLHLSLDLDGQIPSFCVITRGAEHEIRQARRRQYEPDSILVFDRGYSDYHWFHQIALQGAYFVTRLKSDAGYRVTGRRAVDKSTGLTSDQSIRLNGPMADCCPIELRRVGFRDPATGARYFFLTNLFHLSALEIAELYRVRWKVELFFKWIKQHLKIKSFLGTSPNAVMTQIWVALCVYLLTSLIRFLQRSRLRPFQIFRRLRATALEYLPLAQVLAERPPRASKSKRRKLQLKLFPPRAKPLFSTG